MQRQGPRGAKAHDNKPEGFAVNTKTVAMKPGIIDAARAAKTDAAKAKIIKQIDKYKDASPATVRKVKSLCYAAKPKASRKRKRKA